MLVADQRWLQERQTGPGGTDLANLAGVGFREPIDVFVEKTTPVPAERPPSERMRLGLVLEPEVALRYSNATGVDLDLPPAIVRDPAAGHRLCSPDRFTRTEGRRKMVEMKCVFGPPSGEWGEAGSDVIPSGYLIQVTHDLAVCRAAGLVDEDYADVAVLFVGFDFRTYQIPASDRLTTQLARLADEFWPLVERQDRAAAERWKPPIREAIQREALAIKLGDAVQLPIDGLAVTSALDEAKQERDWQQSLVDGYRNQIKAMLAGHEKGVFPDGSTVTLKVVERKGYSVDPSQYVDMRIRRPKQRLS